MTFLSNRIADYHYISQGKTRIPGVNDGEEFQVTDVSVIVVGRFETIICLTNIHLRFTTLGLFSRA